MKTTETFTACILILAAIGEFLHARRCRRIARLAFGPAGRARDWTKIAPCLRTLALASLAWGLATLWTIEPRGVERRAPATPVRRHLVVALDVSPSMQLKDAGETHTQTRAQRASVVAQSILERIDLERTGLSVVAFYTGAKTVVVDTFDLAVVKNVLDDLPLEMAFDPGKTNLIDGVKETATIAQNWAPGSTTLLIVSDGDTVPDTGLPHLPPAIRDALVLGVGSSGAGIYIDGHLSRQDSATLRQLAVRLSGNYFDANERQIPTKDLFVLAQALPERRNQRASSREWALTAIAVGASVLAILSVALALAGSPWPARSTVSRSRRLSLSSAVAESVTS
jgi:Ca-activated chloride channel family protein